MLDVVHKRCAHDGCNKLYPAFNTPGSTRGLYCAAHRRDDMLDVVHKRCAHDGCNRRPAFNTPGSTQGLYCVDHKVNGMVIVVSKRCAHDGCNRRPVFNTPGSTRGLYCAEHKLDGMVNVVSKKCDREDCSTQCNFGFPGRSATHCKQHIQPGMIVNPKRKCSICKEPAIYGVNEPVRCEQHKEPDDLNHVERTCVSCDLTMILNKDDKCQYCDPNEFNKTRLAKQNRVKQWLDANDIEYDSCDRRIENGQCFEYRPDFMFDCGTHMVVLEVDENQHKERAELCECVRMVNIFQSFGMPTKFVRYNPDPYRMKKSKKDPTFNTRMKLLKEHLRYAFDDPPVAPLSVKHLYFDNQEATGFEPVELRNYGL